MNDRIAVTARLVDAIRDETEALVALQRALASGTCDQKDIDLLIDNIQRAHGVKAELMQTLENLETAARMAQAEDRIRSLLH